MPNQTHHKDMRTDIPLKSLGPLQQKMQMFSQAFMSGKNELKKRLPLEGLSRLLPVKGLVRPSPSLAPGHHKQQLLQHSTDQQTITIR